MATGCTACVAIITKDRIICANSGDSRCVIGRGQNALEMSEDHKPDNFGERKRIEAAGGFVEEGRVRGILSLSRALGDLEYK
jgi:serine/threonine protein phosphatase PrpC